jgi:hypothetical protein
MPFRLVKACLPAPGGGLDQPAAGMLFAVRSLSGRKGPLTGPMMDYLSTTPIAPPGPEPFFSDRGAIPIPAVRP